MAFRRENTISSYSGPDRFYPPQHSQSAQSIADRSFYSAEPKHKKHFGSCVWISIVLFVLFILILIICLIVFFTWKPTYAKQIVTEQNGSKLLVYNQPKLNYHRDLLVADALADLLKDASKPICLLDTAHFVANPRQLYLQEHLPNSGHFDLSAVLTLSGSNDSERLAHPLLFQRVVRSLGVNKNCHIVLYDHGEDEHSQSSATCAWWLFKLYGFEQASVLNGGLQAWRRLIERTVPSGQFALIAGLSTPVQKGNFIASWNSYWMVSIDDLLNSLAKGNASLLLAVDARTASAYEQGHVVGAVNFPLSELLTEQGALKTLPTLKKAMSLRRIFGDRPTVVYGDTALDASLPFFVFVQAGYNVKLYDGGWSEFRRRAPSAYRTGF